MHGATKYPDTGTWSHMVMVCMLVCIGTSIAWNDDVIVGNV